MSQERDSRIDPGKVHFKRKLLPLLVGINLFEGRTPDGSLTNYAASPTRLRSLVTQVRHNTILSSGETISETVRNLQEAEKTAQRITGRRSP